jgi:hypothetical protein
MFTGIIQSIGSIKKIESLKKDARITVAYKANKMGTIVYLSMGYALPFRKNKIINLYFMYPKKH